MNAASLNELWLQYSLKARRWYWGLPARDRLIVNFVGFFAVFALVYMLIWSPLKDSADQAVLKWQNKQAVVEWIRTNEAIARSVQSNQRGQGSASQRGGQSLLTVVNSSAQRNNIALKRFEPDGDEKLRVWLENVNFNNSVTWLNSLKNDYGITVSNISVETRGTAGTVDVKIVFKG